jgi:hypothetical protein
MRQPSLVFSRKISAKEREEIERKKESKMSKCATEERRRRERTFCGTVGCLQSSLSRN